MSKRIEFNEDNITVIDFPTLKETYPEYNPAGDPAFNSILHYDFIQRVLDICEQHKVDYKIKEIFAHQNKLKGADGVVLNKRIAEEIGEGMPAAYTMRRVFTTIEIEDLSNEEMNTTIAIAYHQQGIQVAIGPNVRICHNQCILSSERTISTYGTNKVKELDKVFQVIDDWMHNFQKFNNEDLVMIEKMKSIETNYMDIMKLVGIMTSYRVAKDSTAKILRESENNKGISPLTQSQISKFTEKYLIECIGKKTDKMSLWDVYNIGTEFYKPGDTDIPNIIPQNLSFIDVLSNTFALQEN